MEGEAGRSAAPVASAKANAEAIPIAVALSLTIRQPLGIPEVA